MAGFNDQRNSFSPIAVRLSELSFLLSSDEPISIEVNAKEGLHSLLFYFISTCPTGAVVDRAVEVCRPDDVLIPVAIIGAFQQDLETTINFSSGSCIPLPC